ncbi:DUF4865 family protein [Marinobacterium arenosum]|uniref:DUF4865 family protein n=1 Tax=Marinobacterium arenosum TaxID=2862496 RepID=UPI001C97430B|nr:DUF4865 family protein [Marinobacterium arenosum]MBY4679126.1 DUF4865 family protein [Marinobacterium arenosum]
MIAMQYRFVLPADYDMNIVRQRIRDKGHLLDQYPDLAFKAYLFADIRDQQHPAPLNLYAPFYLWENSAGMSRFLSSEGFAALQAAFGRPQVLSWIPLAQAHNADIRQARYAHRQLIPIHSSHSLAELREQEQRRLADQLESGETLACVMAFNPTDWTLLRFSLHRELPADTKPADGEFEDYQVGHLSYPQAT